MRDAAVVGRDARNDGRHEAAELYGGGDQALIQSGRHFMARLLGPRCGSQQSHLHFTLFGPLCKRIRLSFLLCPGCKLTNCRHGRV